MAGDTFFAGISNDKIAALAGDDIIDACRSPGIDRAIGGSDADTPRL